MLRAKKDLEAGWDWCGPIAVPVKAKEEYESARQDLDEEATKHLKSRHTEPPAIETVPEATAVMQPAPPLGPSLKVYDVEELIQLSRTVPDRYVEARQRDRAKRIIESLRQRGPLRRLIPLPPDPQQFLAGLRTRFPNFSAVIDYLAVMFALAAHRDEVIWLDPILLNGPPGVGKTMFAEEVARGLGLGFVFLRMETAQSNSQLAGSSEFWSNTKAGEVFQWLTEKDSANPVFFLDEIDKVSADAKYDPLATLYSLWEPTTASQFRDLSVPWLQLDASHIIWIATCNDVRHLPAPILSRAKRFDIPAPTPEQARRIAIRMFVELRATLPASLSHLRLSCKAVSTLTNEAPRQMRRQLLEACGRALLRGGSIIEVSDLGINRPNASQVRPIGFLS
jgi:ATP-dependent Lon protease